MTEHVLIGVVSVVVLGVSAMWLAWRIGLPSILILLLLGFAAGPLTGLLDPDRLLGDLLFPIVSISVAIILFEGGTSLRLGELRRIGKVVRDLVTLGALTTWVLSALAAYLLLDIGASLAALLGAILVVTGPTVIIPLLRHVRPTGAVASTLKWEGILIDPIGAVLAVLVFEVLVSSGVGAATTAALSGLLRTIAVGGVLAAAGAGLLTLLLRYYWVPDYLQSPMTLMVVVSAFGASDLLQPESGLLTATLMGVILTNQRLVDIKHIVEFKENLGVLLISGLFILLSARLEVADLDRIGAAELGFVAVLMLLVRPLSVALCTLGSELGWRERVFLGWMAPRGIVAAAVSSVFALDLMALGFDRAEQLVPVTFLVIVATVGVYGLTATPVARWLGVARPNPQGVLILGGHAWARAIAGELVRNDIPVRLVDTNYANIAEARLAGLQTYYGNALSEDAMDDMELTGIGRLLALTANDEVNSLAALHFADILGSNEVYQLPSEHLEESPSQVVSRHLRGRFLFAPGATYRQLTARFAAGARVETTTLTREFDFDAFTASHPDAIPMFTISEAGELSVHTVGDSGRPRPGQRLVAMVA